MTRIFHWFFMWKMDPMSGCNIRLVFTLPPRDSTLQYKRCVHFWNNFPCITSLGLMICQWSLTLANVKRCMLVGEIIISLCLKIQPLIQNDKWWPDPPFHSCMMKDLGGETINISTRNYEWRKNIYLACYSIHVFRYTSYDQTSI